MGGMRTNSLVLDDLVEKSHLDWLLPDKYLCERDKYLWLYTQELC